MKEKIENNFDDKNIINNEVNNLNKIKEENKNKININYNNKLLLIEKNEQNNNNKNNNIFFKCFNKISLNYCFFILIGIFLILFILIIFFSVFILFNSLYKILYKKYFIKEIYDPIINSNSNFSHAFNMRNKALNDIILEFRLKNLEIISNFIINNYYDTNINDFSKLKNGMNLYLSTINENMDFNYFNEYKNYLFKIEEFMIFDINSNNKISNKNGYLINFLDSNDKIKKIVDDIENNNKTILYNKNIISNNNNFKSEFADYVIKNEYFYGNNLNYIKFYKKNSLLFLLRMGKESLSNLLHYNENETIAIVPVTNFTNNKLTLHLFYNSIFFTIFFNYGIKNLLDFNNYKYNLINFYDNIEIHNNDLLNFFKILSSYNSNLDYHFLYNIKWENEYKILGQIIYNIAEDKYKNIQIEPFFANNYKNYCNKKHIIYCKITEKNNFIKHSLNYNKNLIFKDDDNNEDLKNDLKINSELSNEFYNETKFGYSWIILNKSKLNNKDSYINYDSKIFVYNNYINNLYSYNIEIFDSHLYKEIKENYIKKTKKIINIMKYVLIGVCFIVLIGSLILFRIEIDKTIQRIRLINLIKDLLLLKKEEEKIFLNENNLLNNSKKSLIEINDNSSKNLKKSFVSSSFSSSSKNKNSNFNTFSNKKNKNFLIKNVNESNSIRNNISLKIEDETSRLMLYKKHIKNKKKKKNNKINDNNNNLEKYFNKKNMYDKNFFKDGNKIIVKYVYECLKNYLENIENNDELNKNLNESFNIKNSKEDCEFSNELFKAINKINLINMNDLSYNIYYNQFYALNQNFRIFKNILNNNIINFPLPFKNNKFLNFNNLLKIIYFFKKEIIQKLIQIVFYNDLKFKFKNIEEFQENYSIENEQINNNLKNNINNEEEDEKEI